TGAGVVASTVMSRATILPVVWSSATTGNVPPMVGATNTAEAMPTRRRVDVSTNRSVKPLAPDWQVTVCISPMNVNCTTSGTVQVTVTVNLAPGAGVESLASIIGAGAGSPSSPSPPPPSAPGSGAVEAVADAHGPVLPLVARTRNVYSVSGSRPEMVIEVAVVESPDDHTTRFGSAVYSMSYPWIATPPSSVGGDHVNSTESAVDVAARLVTADGSPTASVVTSTVVHGPSTPLSAATRNW